jgi:hypothetical protein
MTGRIPAGAPAHVCLLVAVSHPQDKRGPVADPYNDRHWAQRNLTTVTAASGAPAVMSFGVGNPRQRDGSFELRVTQVDEAHKPLLAKAVGAQPTEMRPTVRLLDEGGAELTDVGQRASLAMDLGPRERRPMQLMVSLDADVPAGSATPSRRRSSTARPTTPSARWEC